VTDCLVLLVLKSQPGASERELAEQCSMIGERVHFSTQNEARTMAEYEVITDITVVIIGMIRIWKTHVNMTQMDPKGPNGNIMKN